MVYGISIHIFDLHFSIWLDELGKTNTLKTTKAGLEDRVEEPYTIEQEISEPNNFKAYCSLCGSIVVGKLGGVLDINGELQHIAYSKCCNCFTSTQMQIKNFIISHHKKI